MAFLFTHYSKIRDNCCICYLGNRPDQVVLLNLLLPQIKKTFHDLNISICVKDIFTNLIDAIPYSKLEDYKSNFAFTTNVFDNSLKKFMDESKIVIEPVGFPTKKEGLCLICPDETFGCLSKIEIDQLTALASYKGYTTRIVGSDFYCNYQTNDRPVDEDKLKLIEQSSWVIAPENEYLYLGGVYGAKTTLISKYDNELYKKLFPKGEIRLR